jgi:hypothetical protein
LKEFSHGFAFTFSYLHHTTMAIHFSADDFLHLGLELGGFDAAWQHRTNAKINLARFRANYYACPESCADIFTALQATAIPEARTDEKATVDDLALLHDRQLHPINMENPSMPYLRWDLHPAQGLLKIDVDNGRHELYKPMQLQQTREEYKVFPLEVFCKHIEQEKRSRRETPYWLVKSKKKAKKANT